MKKIIIISIIFFFAIFPTHFLVHEGVHLLQYKQLEIQNDGIHFGQLPTENTIGISHVKGWAFFVIGTEPDIILRGLQNLYLILVIEDLEFQAYAIGIFYMILMTGLLFVLVTDDEI